MSKSVSDEGRAPSDFIFRVLVVDDEELYAQAIGRELERNRISCDLAYSAAEAQTAVRNQSYQAILLDHKLPDDDGIRLIPMLLARQMSATLIMMTAYETIPNAIQAIRQGAEDYIVKQTSIKPIVQRLLEVRQREAIRKEKEGWDEHKSEGLLGRSPGMKAVIEQLQKVATSRETTVLMLGETGVGKEVAAHLLHRLSSGESSPFVPVDCVALPGTLVESLLFGHEKGAFTGADKTREGAFHEAGEGTIFLDEIGEMDLNLQGKLLRVLESRRFQRVGSVREYEVKARIVAATNRDLMELVRQGRFRFDLYQRLSIFPVILPPLRERGEDVLLLARHFLEFFSRKLSVPPIRFSDEAQRRFLAYHFPGNVRELKNIIERSIILAGNGGVIELKHLPERLLDESPAWNQGASAASGLPVDFVPGMDTLESLEVKMIREALRRTKGAKGEAAKILGISRFQLLRRLEKYGLKGEAEEDGEE